MTSRARADGEWIFYDGDCGLCHRWVRFTLARDGAGRFRFAPLAGPTCAELVTPAERAGLPDSLIVLTSGGRLLTRSSAVLYVLHRLGGVARVLARLVGWLPGAWLDRGYDGIARVRGRLAPKPPGACPLVRADLAARFDP